MELNKMQKQHQHRQVNIYKYVCCMYVSRMTNMK